MICRTFALYLKSRRHSIASVRPRHKCLINAVPVNVKYYFSDFAYRNLARLHTTRFSRNSCSLWYRIALTMYSQSSDRISQYSPAGRRFSAMRFQSLFCKATLAAVLLPCFALVTGAQQPSQPQTLVTLSSAKQATLYPEVMCAHCIVPEWDRSYLLHLELDKDPALVTMYDRNGKKLLEARVVVATIISRER